MSAASDYLENELLDHVLSNAAYTSPSAVYLALYTAAPSDAGGGTEVSGTGYAREAASFGAASGGAAALDTEIVFTAGGSWGTVTHWGIFDASTSGNLLFHGALAASKTIGNGDSLTFAIGGLEVTAA